MADGLCDWQGCIDPNVQPAILRVHREAGDPHEIVEIARQYELCPLHTQALLQWTQVLHEPLEAIPFDPGAGD
jgi:hypothetical protein